jgi:hypothetical protein
VHVKKATKYKWSLAYVGCCFSSIFSTLPIQFILLRGISPRISIVRYTPANLIRVSKDLSRMAGERSSELPWRRYGGIKFGAEQEKWNRWRSTQGGGQPRIWLTIAPRFATGSLRFRLGGRLLAIHLLRLPLFVNNSPLPKMARGLPSARLPEPQNFVYTSFVCEHANLHPPGERWLWPLIGNRHFGLGASLPVTLRQKSRITLVEWSAMQSQDTSR